MIQPIPAIDLIDGKCVRLTKGNYDSKKVYSNDPVEMAKKFESFGFKRLHVVDLDGAKSHHVVNLKVLQQITTSTKLSVDFGGGIKSDEDLTAVFDSGAEYATIGSVAVTQPEKFMTWLEKYGSQRLILGADEKDGFISINGWKEESKQTLFDFLNTYINKGVTHILCTDISKDGMLQGTAVKLYQQIMSRFPACQLIASGGVSSMEDIILLDKAGIPAVVFGKAIYEGKISLEEVAKQFKLKVS